MNDTLNRLQNRAATINQSCRSYLERAAKGEATTAQERAAYDEASRELEGIVKLLTEEREYSAAWEASGATKGHRAPSADTEVRYNSPLPQGGRFVDLPGAKRTATLTHFGEYAQSLMLGRESRAQSEGVASEGGNIVPTLYAAPILDLAANQMRIVQAGTKVVPMGSQVVKIGRLDSDPVPSWRAEAAAIAESSAVFGQVTLAAKSLAVHTKVSLELLEDAAPSEIGDVLGNSLARSFALELDRVALYGSGASNQPLGLKGQSGVTITSFVGANGGTFNVTNGWFSSFVDTVGRLRTKNYQPSGVLYSERTNNQFGKAVDTTNNPLVMPPYLRDAAPHLPTGQIPNNLTVGTSTDCSDFIVGDFQYALLGLRTSFTLMRNTDAFMVSNGQIALVGWLRADFTLARGAAFEILAGLRA
jgi:HK97 family phage major capsid protein